MPHLHLTLLNNLYKKYIRMFIKMCVVLNIKAESNNLIKILIYFVYNYKQSFNFIKKVLKYCGYFLIDEIILKITLSKFISFDLSYIYIYIINAKNQI